MKNAKEYKRRLENHDDARYTFEHWNGMSIYPSYNMTPEDIKELRAEYKKDKAQNVATQLDTRAIEIEYMDNVYILKSYYTNVACIYNNKLYKLWNGYSNTTLKHINLFLDKHNMPTITKYDWIMQDVEHDIVIEETGEIITLWKTGKEKKP